MDKLRTRLKVVRKRRRVYINAIRTDCKLKHGVLLVEQYKSFLVELSAEKAKIIDQMKESA